MAKLEFTQSKINSVARKTRAKREKRWDTNTPGLGLVMHPTGKASYVVQSFAVVRQMIEPFMEIFAKIPQGESLIHVDELAVHAARPADAVKFLLEHYEPGKQVTIAPAD